MKDKQMKRIFLAMILALPMAVPVGAVDDVNL
jgi:hypothetical protein